MFICNLCNGQITRLSSQAEVNEFDSSIQDFQGFLYIEGDDIVDLGPLSNLRSISATLSISSNPLLRNLDGLENLRTIGGGLVIRSNSALEQLSAIEAIDVIAGGIDVIDNDKLSSLDFPKIKSFSNNFSIEFNPLLSNIEFPQLESIGGYVILRSNDSLTELNLDLVQEVEWLELTENESLRFFRFSAIEKVDGKFIIEECGALEEINLPNLKSVGEEFHFISLNALRYLSAPRLISIGGEMRFRICRSIDNVNLSSLSILGGLHLSFNDNLEEIVWGDIVSMDGDIEISNNPKIRSIDFSKLKSTSGGISINGEMLEQINLANLETMDGDLYLSSSGPLDELILSKLSGNVDILSIQVDTITSLDLSSLTMVNKRFSIFGMAIENLLIHNIRTVGGNFEIEIKQQSEFTMPNLREVGGDFTIPRNTELRFLSMPQLRSVGVDFQLARNPLLEEIDFPALEEIGLSLYISHNGLRNLDGFKKLRIIGSQISLSMNSELQNIDGLSTLQSFGNDIVSIRDCYSLESIDGLSTMENVASSFTISNTAIRSLKMPALLQTESLNISSNDSLRLIEMPILNLVESDLEINGNDNLKEVNMGSLTEVGSGFVVRDNEQLSDCCGIKNLVEFRLIEGLALRITGNNIGCSSPDEIINSECGDNFFLAGNLLVDVNNDGCASSNTTLPNPGFLIDTPSQRYSYLGFSDGSYSIPVSDTGYYYIQSNDWIPYYEVDPLDLELSMPQDSNRLEQDFCLFVFEDAMDLRIDLFAIDQVRPGFVSRYKIKYQNIGTINSDDFSVTLDYPKDSLTIESISLAGDTSTEGKVKWDFQNLKPYEQGEINISFKANSPTDPIPLFGSETVNFSASINSLVQASEANNADNAAHLIQTVVNSFDPNDKQCAQGDIIPTSMVGEYLQYIIRFENIGTASARKVEIVDLIDTETLDVSSLRIVESSHSMATEIRSNNEVHFVFENIDLPFDDDNNDGYVVFQIRTLKSLVLGDLVENAAEIYFDFNIPIHTKTAITEIKNIPTQTQEIDQDIVRIYPNPTVDKLHIINSSSQSRSAKIISTLGFGIQTVELDVGANLLNINSLETGLYFLLLDNKSVLRFSKL